LRRDLLDPKIAEHHGRIVKTTGDGVRVYMLRPGAVAAAPVSRMPPTTSIPQPAMAPRLSIVVLPFANLSDDREQQYFADGITEDLTTDLSRLAPMFVISGNTAFTYRNKPVDTKQIGRELGVRYVLEGSVQRSGNHVRVNAQLIDAATDAHLWAERFDGDTGDLFALQDEITSRIAGALNLAAGVGRLARAVLGAKAFEARPGFEQCAVDREMLRRRRRRRRVHTKRRCLRLAANGKFSKLSSAPC
jgi:adenylate cyclase